jgi:hypothetical protein
MIKFRRRLFMEQNLINAISTVGFPIVAAIGTGCFCYKICITKLDELDKKIDKIDEKLDR